MELHLLVLQERKNIFLARQISERQRGMVMAFIPDRIQTPQQWRPLAVILPSENPTATWFQMSRNLSELFAVIWYPAS